MFAQSQQRKFLVIILSIIAGLLLVITLHSFAQAQGRSAQSEVKTPEKRMVDSPTAPAADPCFATPDDGTTLFSSADASALQDAVDDAASGGTVKVAGTCTGVQVIAGLTQTVYLSKSLIIQGGYTTTNWLAPDPDIYTTTLDAAGSGSVATITGTAIITLDGLTLVGGNAHEGGGIWAHSGAALTLVDSTIFSNTAIIGGGIFKIEGALSMSNSNVISNSAIYGGGIYNYSTTLTIKNSDIISNTAGRGGGIYNDHNMVYVSDSTISKNYASQLGGGLLNYGATNNMSNTIVSGNSAGQDGGGIYNASGTSIIQSSTISGNSARLTGGGLWTYSNTATINNSTVTDNDAGVSGGGLAAISGSNLTFTNSTISGNEVSTSTLSTYVGGGGAYLFDDAWVNLQWSTFVSNTAPNISGKDGIVLTKTAMINISSSILAYNGDANCTLNGLSTLNDYDYNLEDKNTCGFTATGSLTNTNPQLMPLANNGGPTWTNAPPPDALVIDVIPPGSNGCGTTNLWDQRGIGRPQGPGCDIGAFEAAPSELTVSIGGSGAGSVTSAPAGIDCPGDCSEIYAYGTEVTLTAATDPTSSFSGWGGDCSGMGSCTVTMIKTTAITGEFFVDPAGNLVYLPLVTR